MDCDWSEINVNHIFKRDSPPTQVSVFVQQNVQCDQTTGCISKRSSVSSNLDFSLLFERWRIHNTSLEFKKYTQNSFLHLVTDLYSDTGNTWNMSASELDSYLRRGRRRSSRTPFNPFKSLENQIDLDSADLASRRNSSCEDGLLIEIQSKPFSDFYDADEELGRGKFATVKKCFCKVTGKEYAAKFQRKRRKAKDARAEIIAEIRMLEMCRIHPNIVDLVAVFETRHEIIIVTEYCLGGELYNHMEDVENGFSENDTRHVLKETLEGLAFLHQRNIVHMDVKPQNVLLSGNKINSQLKLCDLGFSRAITSGQDVRDLVGTPDFVAPEVLSYEPISTASDMWSVGVLAYMLLTGHSPFAGNDKMETYSNITSAKLDFPSSLFSHISNEAKDFIKGLLKKNPSDRMSATDCLEHVWFQESESSTSEISSEEPSLSQDDATEEPGRLSKDTSDSGRETFDSGSNSSLDSCAESMWTAPGSAHHSDSGESDEFVIATECIHGDGLKEDEGAGQCCQTCSQSAVAEQEVDLTISSVNAQSLTDISASELSNSYNNDNELTLCSVQVSTPKPGFLRFETLHEAEEEEEEELSVLQTVDAAPQELPTKAVATTVPTPSPMASPIGCRRSLACSPQTIKETEPSIKHLCRREDSYKVETTLLLDLDLAEESNAKADRRSVCLSHKAIQLHKMIPSSQKSIHLKSH